MIYLKLQDVHFMLNNLELSSDLKKMLYSLVTSNEKSISNDIADELRDLCAERLDTHGFGIDYEPTKEGQQLEYLIDKLYTG